MIFHSFAEAEKYMGEKACRPYPKGSPRSTKIHYLSAQRIVVKYHWTNVVIFRPDYIELQTGGWQTVTTKRRINDAVAGSVSQCHWQWTYYDPVRKMSFDFFDGMQVDYEGKLLNPPQELINEKFVCMNWKGLL